MVRKTAMNIARMHFRVIVGCISLLLITVSCSTKISDIRTDPSFSPERVTESGLAILGCTSIVADTLDAFVLSNQLSVHLQQALRKERGNIKIVEWGDVRRAVGDEKLQRCLAAVREYGTLEATLVESLSAGLGNGARYVIVHRIESDQLKFNESDDQEFVDGVWVVKGTLLKTTRSISVAFSVYDLENGKRVWEATIEGAKETKRKVGLDEPLDIGGWVGTAVDVVDAMDEIFGEDDAVQFPKPASQASVMKSIYGKFAKELPKN